MKPVRTIALVLCMCLMPSAVNALPQPLKSTQYLGYNWVTGQNDRQQSILYQFPDPARFGPGPYPVFMWIPATYEFYVDAMSVSFVNQMAARGFVAASVQYHNLNAIQACPDYIVRAKAIFEATRLTSAAGVLCSLSGVNCGRGIVTAGMSQGGMIAVLAKNYAPRVEAVFAMSISNYNQNGIGVDLSSCMDKPYTAIPANRLTIVNGQDDPYFGGQAPLEKVSGFTCPAGAFQCWSPDGSGAGWYRVQDAFVTDGNADHCYQMVGDCSLTVFDTNWYFPSAHNWSLKPNLDWLSTLGTRRVFSTTGQ